jgi:hypothetical protein
MRRYVLFGLLVLVMVIANVGSAYAGGYTHGKATGSCSFSPVSALEGQSFTVNAVGLPTTVEVDLVVTNYETITHGYPNLAVNPDGTWSGSFTETNDGKFTFQFVSPSTNGSRLPDKDAVCAIWIS